MAVIIGVVEEEEVNSTKCLREYGDVLHALRASIAAFLHSPGPGLGVLCCATLLISFFGFPLFLFSIPCLFFALSTFEVYGPKDLETVWANHLMMEPII